MDGYLRRAPLFRREVHTEVFKRLVVVYDLAAHEWNSRLWAWISEDLAETATDWDMFGPNSPLAEVIVRVSTENDKERAVELQIEDFESVPEPERTRRLALITYEITNPTVAVDLAST